MSVSPVVVVEDDAAMNKLVCAYARLAGFEPRGAVDGAGAMAEVRREPRPALVVLDLMLPDMSGEDVCRRLKADAATAGIPVLVLTAMHDVAHRERMKACGAAEYMTKPFTPDALIGAIRKFAAAG